MDRNRKIIIEIDGVVCEFYMAKTSIAELMYLQSKADSFVVLGYR